MGLKVDGILFDELTADPGTPAEGQVWYNTTDNRFKIYRNGGTQQFPDLAELTAHTGATSNPHTVTLEQARTAGNTLSGDIDMGGNAITNLTGGSTAATQSYVTDQINQKIRGQDWQESVLDKDTLTPPGSPSTGDRYLINGTGTGAWVGHDLEIAEWNGSAWVYSSPTEGFATRVEDENKVYIYDGASWGIFEATLDHGSLLGKDDDDHTQYLLIAGTRAMTGGLDMGGNAISNVGNVDGVDVSAHAARHERGGGDEIDGDHLDIDFTPTNYTPSTSPAEAANVDDLAAHLAGIDDAIGAGGGGGLATKAGSVVAGSFAGNPKTATVTFSAAFSDANYAVTLTAVTTGNTGFAPNVQSQVAGSFVIALGSNNTNGLTQVNWVAVKHGETA